MHQAPPTPDHRPDHEPARLLAVCAGPVTAFRHLQSAIHKQVLSSLEQPLPVAVDRLGVRGDEQAETGIHGGPSKAVYMAPVEHWGFWQQQRAQIGRDEPMAYGFVGENLTVQGLLEASVFAGDQLIIGDVRLQITEPRIPCLKFNWRMGYAKAAKQMIQSGRSGWYCAVLESGNLIAGEPITLLPGRQLMSIADQLRLQQRALERQLDLF
ncbi:MAG: MOSC domain-containing protein [Betaproteobacteria bacterium]|nr:MOSC domain-containing protein [Betaproteobacteria bacterium]